MIRSASSIVASGTIIATRRSAKYAPPNRAIASTGVKLYGIAPWEKWISRRQATAIAIIAISTPLRGEMTVSDGCCMEFSGIRSARGGSADLEARRIDIGYFKLPGAGAHAGGVRVIHAQRERTRRWQAQRVAEQRPDRSGVRHGEHHVGVVGRAEQRRQPRAGSANHVGETLA